MKITIEMPLEPYDLMLKACKQSSKEFRILNSGCIDSRPDGRPLGTHHADSLRRRTNEGYPQFGRSSMPTCCSGEREAAWKLYKLDDDFTYSEARRAKKSIWGLLYKWKRDGVNGLAGLYVSNRQPGGTATFASVGFITWLNLEINCIGDEIQKRVSKYPVGSALIGEVMRDAVFPYEQLLNLIQKQSRTSGGRFSMRDIFKPAHFSYLFERAGVSVGSADLH